jgi:hypothetical protein
VAASTGTGNGTLGLNLVDDDSITDSAGNKLGGTGTSGAGDGSFTGEVYTIDKTAPTVTLDSVNGSAVTFPYSTNQNVNSVGGSCTSGDGPVSVTLGGNPTSPATASCLSGGWTLTLNSALSAEGTYTFAASQTDAAGNPGSSGNKSITIDKTAPTVTVNQASASDPFGANQADPATTTPIHFTAIFSEPVNGFNNGAVTIGGTASAGAIANVYNPSNDKKTWDIRVTPTVAGTITVAIGGSKVTDGAGNPNTASTSSDNTVTYQPSAGTAPTVTIDSPTFGAVYAKGSVSINPLTLNAHFSDPDNGPWTWNINWDDTSGTCPTPNANTCPSSNGTVSGTSTTNSPFSATHTFTNVGVYTINVKVKDSSGLSGTATVWIVVYDPSAGFITGGGWLDVVAGSYIGGPGLAGRANFGFNSQYKKGATVPTGETEFNFQAGNMDFHSTVYNWLIVSGYKAQYKGTGTINGAGKYSFTLTAYDGDLMNPTAGPDKFRIRITDDNNSNAVVFDNRITADASPNNLDTADPQVISGGSIVIHKA